MKDAAALIQAAAALLWPIFGFTVLIWFRRELRELIGRIKKGKFLGQEVELHQKLSQLEQKAVETADIAAALPAPSVESTDAKRLEPSRIDEADLSRTVLKEAGRSPKAALLLLASELEGELRQLLASMGLLKRDQAVSFRDGLGILEQRGGLPSRIGSTAKLFYDVRNKLVHGGASSDDDVLSAIDSGLLILRSLNAIPHEKNFVSHPGVTVYEDSSCVKPRPEVLGVILETKSPGGVRTDHRIFPTTHKHFRKGARVAWEWNLELVVGESWYRDPDTDEAKYAWTQSGEFTGRSIDDV